MYDTLQIWVPVEIITDPIILPRLRINLTNARETISIANRTSESVGWYKNFYIKIRDAGVLIAGSLCKYHLGNNQQTLSLTDAALALANLATDTGLPLSDSFVYRIDIADNYVLEHPVWEYIDSLGSATYYKRLTQDNSVNYRCSKRQIAFYDKVKELEAHGEDISEEFQGHNVLRYEMRLTKKIPEQTSVSEVTVAHLVEPIYYKELLIKYQKEYTSINKVYTGFLDLKPIEDGKDLFLRLARAGASLYGGEEGVLKQIDLLRNKPYFNDPANRSRLKKRIKEMFKAPFDVPDIRHYISELDEKIDERISRELLAINNMIESEQSVNGQTGGL